jgi:glycosyltransferase involved in cell wall biosynthesis
MVVSIYGYDATRAPYVESRWRRRYSTLFAASRAVLVEGPALAQRVVALGSPSDLTHIIRLPFSPVGADLDLPAVEPDFAAVLAGRLVPKKGFHIGLRAFARAFPRGSERLLVVGSGPEEKRLRRLARTLGLEDRIEIRGMLTFGELCGQMKRARVALFPSVTSRDGEGEGGAPLIIPLAQRLGIPVVVSDHDDLPWAAAPGTPVVGEGDDGDLSEALGDIYRASVAGDTGLGRNLEAARAWVDRQHDANRLVEQREQIYDQVIDSPRLGFKGSLR